MRMQKCECTQNDKSKCHVFGHSPMYRRASWYYGSTKKQDDLKIESIGGNICKDETGGFYFWDEAGVDCCGPFDSIEDTKEAIKAYSRDFLG